jgi:hypothetical protein
VVIFVKSRTNYSSPQHCVRVNISSTAAAEARCTYVAAAAASNHMPSIELPTAIWCTYTYVYVVQRCTVAGRIAYIFSRPARTHELKVCVELTTDLSRVSFWSLPAPESSVWYVRLYDAIGRSIDQQIMHQVVVNCLKANPTQSARFTSAGSTKFPSPSLCCHLPLRAL